MLSTKIIMSLLWAACHQILEHKACAIIVCNKSPWIGQFLLITPRIPWLKARNRNKLSGTHLSVRVEHGEVANNDGNG